MTYSQKVRGLKTSMPKNTESSVTSLEAWLVLHQVRGLSHNQIQALLDRWQTPEAIIKAPPELLLHGLKQEQVICIKQPDWKLIEKTLIWAESNNCYIITQKDPAYPPLLLQIPKPPLLLFCKGSVSLLKTLQLAVVGTRQPSPGGIEMARYFAKQLVEFGLTVTSGLALGIDGASHFGALEGNGHTIAVLGSGVEYIYPRQHNRLAERIINFGGVLVSEYEPGSPSQAFHFPQRNRIISGLSLGVLVIEAALKSGSLITARLAAEFGREVFALPGHIAHPQAQGCLKLIQQGAKLVTHFIDIISELSALATYCVESSNPIVPEVQSTFQSLPLDQSSQKLLQCVDYTATNIDHIVVRSGWTVQQVRVLLSSLELDGYITAVPGGYLRIKNARF